MRTSPALGRFLVGCTTHRAAGTGLDELALLAAGIDPQQLLPAVRHHRVPGCVWLGVARSGALPEATRHALEEAYFAALARHLVIVEELGFVASALDGAGVEWAAVKGPVLSELVYERPDLRAYTDLDVLVDPSALADTVAALEGRGGRLLDANWQMIAETVPGELHLQLPTGGVLDLHWHVVCERGARRTVTMPTRELLARSRREYVGAHRVPVLDPVDTLIHVAVHASMSGADRLVWLKDVEQCLLRWAPDWAQTTDRARAHGAAVPTALLLARTRSVLGVPVPDEALRDLLPSRAWRHLLAATDLFWPVSRATSGGSPARLLARAARDDVSSTRREAGRRLAAWLSDGRRVAPRQMMRELDPSYPGSLLHESGSGHDRASFFRAASSEAGRTGAATAARVSRAR